MGEHADWTAIWISLKVAATAMVLITPPGIFLGHLLARAQFRGKTIVEAAVNAPLVLPPVITGYLLLLLLGRNGPLGQPLHQMGLSIAFTWLAAVLAAAVMGFPLLVRSVKVAVSLVDPGLEVAAATLGASPTRIFFKVTLPLAAPGVLTGLSLAFARGLGEFGATIVLAGNMAGETRTIPLAVFTYMQTPGGDQRAYTLAAVSVGLSLGALVFSEYLSARSRREAGVWP